MNKIKYTETYMNTIYVNFELEYKGESYEICVDYAGGIQDVEIAMEGEDFESIYESNNTFLRTREDRDAVHKIVVEAFDKQDLLGNIQIGG